MIRGLIIDLDNCVFDTKSMGRDFVSPIVNVLRGCERYLRTPEIFYKITDELWNFSLEDVIERNRIPGLIAVQMREAYQGLRAPDCSRCYEDIGILKSLPGVKILVTSGHFELQWSKIEIVGIGGLFDEIIIDAVDDPFMRKGKLKIFEELMDKNCWEPEEILVIGDNAFSELAAGKELGMITVQTLRPEVSRVEGFDHYINVFEEINEIIAVLQKF